MNIEKRRIDELIPADYNPRKELQPGDPEFEKLKRSIQEFGLVEPIILNVRTGRVVGGHQRLNVLKSIGEMETDVVIVDLEEDKEKALNIALNKVTGEWDQEKLKALLFDLSEIPEFDATITGFDQDELQASIFGSDVWFQRGNRNDHSKQDGNDEYNEFLEKFEDKKTTDDCYTPDNIYAVIAEFVVKRYKKNKRDFVRPFFPGGDYQGQKYKKDDVIVDNPPFSILSEIVDFYIENGRPFFLFAPGLAALNYCSRKNVAAICTYAGITYENGANVPTSFVTNMEDPDIIAMTCPELFDGIKKANAENERLFHRELPKYEYPVEVLTTSKMGQLSKYGQDLVIRRESALLIRELDAQKGSGKAIYGSGLLLSEKAAAEKAAAEKAAAEKAAAEKWQLSDREKAIVRSLL